MRRFVALFLGLVFFTACAERAAGPLEGEWVDLSHSFGEDTIY